MRIRGQTRSLPVVARITKENIDHGSMHPAIYGLFAVRLASPSLTRVLAVSGVPVMSFSWSRCDGDSLRD